MRDGSCGDVLSSDNDENVLVEVDCFIRNPLSLVLVPGSFPVVIFFHNQVNRLHGDPRVKISRPVGNACSSMFCFGTVYCMALAAE